MQEFLLKFIKTELGNLKNSKKKKKKKKIQTELILLM